MVITAPDGFDCRYVEVVDSTNDALKTEAEAGAPDGTVIAAGQQTAGRGRYGRTWASPPGNLYVSVLLRDIGPIARAAQMSFVTAVALGNAIAALTPDDLAVRFKWPNDILANDAKIAGILLESGGSPESPWLVIGTGINLCHHPEGAGFRATNLAALGATVTGPALIHAYLRALSEWRARWRAHGFAPVRAGWLAAAANRGGPVTLKLADKPPREGRFVDLDEEGALLFQPSGTGGMERIAAGEVHFPPRA